MALTDHDTVEGCAPMALACASEGIEFIPGTELTAEVDGIELHLLGYFLDTSNPTIARGDCPIPSRAPGPDSRDGRPAQSAEYSVAGRSGFCVGQLPSPGRPHVARALVQAGILRQPRRGV